MGGPGSGRKRGKPKAQPRGAAWLDARRQCFALYGDICHICGHPGATQADHVIPVVNGDPAAYLDTSNLRPAHGGYAPCPVCGKRCNQVKGGPRRMAAVAARNGSQNAPVTDLDEAAKIRARAQLAALDHAPDCPCSGSFPRSADAPTGHGTSCRCGPLQVKLGVRASRCW